MEELEHAISAAGGVGKLAEKLNVKPNVISNWRLRNSVPLGWKTVLRDRFGTPKTNTKQPAGQGA